jgi:bleomycin hydrolase
MSALHISVCQVLRVDCAGSMVYLVSIPFFVQRRGEVMRTTFAVAVLLLSLLSLAFGQNGNAVTPQLLQEVENSCQPDAQFKSVQHALAQVDAKKISLNWQKMISVDAHFSNRLTDEKITDQKASGRCWMFSALNIFRRAAARSLTSNEVEFSQNYLFFYDKLEKSNVFLEAIIRSRNRPSTDRYVEWLMRNPVQDGGNWLGFTELVKKYGVVPKEIMPETFSSSNSNGVNGALGLRLKVAAVKIRKAKSDAEISALRLRALKDAYRILALNFGIPPKQFEWRYEDKDRKLSPFKTYTPQQFYHDVVDDALDDYLALYSIPTLEFNKKYEIDLDKAVEDRPNMFFVNCPLDTLKDLAKNVLLDNRPVWFGCDVGQETFSDSGLMMPGMYDCESMYGMEFGLSRKELFETYSSVPNHNMVFTGIDIVDGKPVKWLVENSWGEKAGKKGFFVMLDDWFDRYVQVVVVQRKYVSESLLAVFKTKAETLPPWDPMMKALGYE